MKGRALLAWNLRRLRAERGISQENLATDAEVDRAYVSELERKIGNASVDLLDKLSNALDVGVAEFFRVPGPEEKRPKPLKSGRPRTRSKPKRG